MELMKDKRVLEMEKLWQQQGLPDHFFKAFGFSIVKFAESYADIREK